MSSSYVHVCLKNTTVFLQIKYKTKFQKKWDEKPTTLCHFSDLCIECACASNSFPRGKDIFRLTLG